MYVFSNDELLSLDLLILRVHQFSTSTSAREAFGKLSWEPQLTLITPQPLEMGSGKLPNKPLECLGLPKARLSTALGSDPR